MFPKVGDLVFFERSGTKEIAMGKICEVKIGEPTVVYVRFVVDGKLFEKGVFLTQLQDLNPEYADDIQRSRHNSQVGRDNYQRNSHSPQPAHQPTGGAHSSNTREHSYHH